MFLQEGKPDAAQATRAKALAKVRALIAPVAKKSGTANDKLRAELKKALAEIAKYKKLAASATARERIRLHASLDRAKESFLKKMKHDNSYKGRLAKVAKRAAAAVAMADVKADKYRALLKVSARKASYAKAAEKTIATLENKLRASGKATSMVAARMKKDEKTISKMRSVIANLRGAAKSQASKVTSVKEKKAKAKARLKSKLAAQKAKHAAKAKSAKKKAKKKQAKLKAKAAKHKARAAKHKSKSQKLKAKKTKGYYDGLKTKQTRKLSIREQIRREKLLMKAAHHKAARFHVKAASAHLSKGDKSSASISKKLATKIES